ncbi:AraC family transcriptional regulator [Nocardioides sambongensis]|uniref:AraC family transcriptional regulator n=1 Tax=Nocardioides sambongensis TaxID=2589074 RepID=UPI0011263D89|nr:AraC family transcriptional regulator [Nocardioides sambongensis]
MLVLDSGTVAPAERADFVSCAMADAAYASHTLPLGAAPPQLRMERWELGVVGVFHTRISPMVSARTERQARADEAPVLALVLGFTTAMCREQDDLVIAEQAGAVDLIDLSRAYRTVIPGGTDGWCAEVALAELRLDPGTIRRARPRLSASPVAGVFAQHLRELQRYAAAHGEEIELAPAAAALLGRTTVTLARALIASAAGCRDAGDALEESLLLRVQSYVRTHLGDPDLDIARIAAVHSVSVRHLFAVFAAAGLRLEQWVIAERLEAARHELGGPAGRHRTIGAVARRWGFRSHAHFTHRFRDTYGMSPREWREAARRVE